MYEFGRCFILCVLEKSINIGLRERYKELIFMVFGHLGDGNLHIIATTGCNDDKQDMLRVYLRYNYNNDSVIRGIKRISKPGRRHYVNRDTIPKVLNGLGVAIVSTSAGVFTDTQCREKGVGGEVIGHIW